MSDSEILFEDNHIIVVVKPAGMLSQADKTGDPDMLAVIKSYIKTNRNKPGDAWIGLVHRLDRGTGGVMVFAKTSKAASRLSETIRKQEMGKTYYAVLDGIPKERSGTLLSYLVKDTVKNKVSWTDADERDAKEAILAYKICGIQKERSLVQVDLKTGKSHQIRAQFAQIGCPVTGDVKYGSKTRGLRYPALWAYSLSFAHPVKKEIVAFSKEPPKGFPWNDFFPADR